MMDMSSSQLVNSVPPVERIRLTDLNDLEIYLDKNDGTSPVDLKTVFQDKNARRWKTRFRSVSPQGSSYTTNKDQLIRCTDLNLKEIQVSTSDIQNSYVVGRMTLTIKDEAGDASNTPISIVGEGGETIDGQANTTISLNYGSLTLYSDGTNLFTLNRFG